MIDKPKIIFFGTPDFAAIVLEKMIKADYIPVAVVTAPDKPVGRKQILTPSPVKALAEKNKITVLQPDKIENCKLPLDPELGVEGEIGNLKPDLIVLAAYGQIIPQEILDIPKYGSLNIHPSLLPKYRGPSPIQAAIINGDKETGITIMLMDEKMDHGPILQNKKLNIKNKKYNYLELSKILAELGAELLIETLPGWLAGEIKPVPQDHSKATYTKIIKKEDGHINWQSSAEYIERQVRAFNPWPSAYTQLMTDNKQQTTKRLKIIRAKILNESLVDRCQLKVGQVFLTEDKKLAVACGKDALILEEVQIEGKRQMSGKDFLNGYPEIIGSTLI